jgi:hypothetical protein
MSKALSIRSLKDAAASIANDIKRRVLHAYHLLRYRLGIEDSEPQEEEEEEEEEEEIQQQPELDRTAAAGGVVRQSVSEPNNGTGSNQQQQGEEKEGDSVFEGDSLDNSMSNVGDVMAF